MKITSEEHRKLLLAFQKLGWPVPIRLHVRKLCPGLDGMVVQTIQIASLYDVADVEIEDPGPDHGLKTPGGAAFNRVNGLKPGHPDYLYGCGRSVDDAPFEDLREGRVP